MDLYDLAAKARAARQFTVVLGAADAPRTITLHAPTQHEVTVAGLRAGVGKASDPAAMPLLQRALLCAAVTGWAGVLCTDLVPDLKAGGQDEAPFGPGATELLLDANPLWEQSLWIQLAEVLATRVARTESAAKN